MPMQFREIAPAAALRPYIASYWMIRGEPGVPIRDRTYPDGCQEVVFNINSTVMRSDSPGGYSRNPNAELIGQMTRYYDIETNGEQCYFGIKFYPHGFSVFTREPIHDLRDQSIPVNDVLNLDAAPLLDRIFSTSDFETFVDFANRYFRLALAEKKAASKSYQLVDRAVRILLEDQDELNIDTLRQQLGIGHRRLQTLFRDFVGLSPKQLLRMIRFQTSFRFLHDANLALTDVAMLSGYYDQAHFNHDFKAYAGITPTRYRESQLPLNRFFLDENSLSYLG